MRTSIASVRVAVALIVTLCGFAGEARSQVLYGSVNFGPTNPGDLYTIDPTTGDATLVGSIGFNVTGAMDFHPVTGVLYATARRTSDATPVLITIDTSTGAGTEVGPLVNSPTAPQKNLTPNGGHDN